MDGEHSDDLASSMTGGYDGYDCWEYPADRFVFASLFVPLFITLVVIINYNGL